jgi:hypothetical protein
MPHKYCIKCGIRTCCSSKKIGSIPIGKSTAPTIAIAINKPITQQSVLCASCYHHVRAWASRNGNLNINNDHPRSKQAVSRAVALSKHQHISLKAHPHHGDISRVKVGSVYALPELNLNTKKYGTAPVSVFRFS